MATLRQQLLASITQERGLAHILTDIQEARAEVASLDAKLCVVAVGSREEDGLSDLAAAADDRLLDLQDEAKAMIHTLTGVRWSAIERGLC